jgi:hypothetical protein
LHQFVRPMLVAWRQLREQIAVFDKTIHVLVRSNSACRLLCPRQRGPRQRV